MRPSLASVREGTGTRRHAKGRKRHGKKPRARPPRGATTARMSRLSCGILAGWQCTQGVHRGSWHCVSVPAAGLDHHQYDAQQPVIDDLKVLDAAVAGISPEKRTGTRGHAKAPSSGARAADHRPPPRASAVGPHAAYTAGQRPNLLLRKRPDLDLGQRPQQNIPMVMTLTAVSALDPLVPRGQDKAQETQQEMG